MRIEFKSITDYTTAVFKIIYKSKIQEKVIKTCYRIKED